MKQLLLILLLIISSRCSAQLPHWESLGINFNLHPRALYVDTEENVMYIAGQFDNVGGVAAKVIKWDGHHYTLLPVSPKPADPIFCITKYQGKLYIAGGGGIYRFNGIGWDTLDSKMQSVINFFHYQGKLVMSGPFKKIGGLNIGSAALWDGSTWTDFYNVDTLIGPEYWQIASIVEYKGELYIGGNINPIGKPSISEIAKFDGQHWVTVGGGITGGNLAAVDQLLVWKDELYICGEFREQDGAQGNCIVRWDGHNYHRLEGGVLQYGESAIYEMKVYHDNLYVMGPFDNASGVKINSRIARWDGNRWCSIGDTVDNIVLCAAVYKDELYFAGGFRTISYDSSFNRMAKWIGGDYTDSCSTPTSINPPPGPVYTGTLYPNPATHQIFISMPDIVSVSILDVQGKLVSNINNYIPTAGIDVHELANGVYLVRIKTSTNIACVKLVKR